MTHTRTRGLWLPAVLLALCTASALARTGVLVLRDGMQSEYAFCREDEFGGWGERHPAVAMFRAGLLGHARRFERYLADSPGLSVQTLDLEAHEGRLPLAGVGLVILDDVRSSVAAPVAAQIARFVDRGGALIVVGGFQGFGGHSPHPRFSMTKAVSDYRDTALAPLLPIEVRVAPDYTISRVPRITLDRRFPLGPGLDPADWPLHGYHDVRAKPTARILATVDDAPLVAWHAVGRSFVVAFTGSELEAAHTRPNADPWPDEPLFWQRMAALALDVLDVKVELTTETAGPAQRLAARLTSTGQAARRLVLDAWAEDPDGTRWPAASRENLRLARGRSASWTGNLPLRDLPPGPYRAFVRVADPSRDGALYAASAPFRVEPPPIADIDATLRIPESIRRGAPLKGQAEVAGKAAAKGLELHLLAGRRLLASLPLPKGTSTFQIATAPLRPGRYTLEIAGERPAAVARFHVASYSPHFQNLLWWGQGDFPDGSALRRRMVEDLLAHRAGAAAPADLCQRHGIWAMETTGGIRALSKAAGADQKPDAQWLDAAARRRGTLCFNDPLFAAELPRWAASLAERYRSLHSLGFIHIEDEAACPDCYCEDCRRLFKEQYGFDMPTPEADFSPAFLEKWFNRMDFKLATFARYHKAVRDAFHQHLPAVPVLTSLPQGFTVAHGETVIDHQRHLDAFWEHTYPGTEPLGAALTAHRTEMAAAALGALDRPCIHLLQGFDAVARAPKMPPAEYIRLIAWMAVAHGADHIGWFAYRWMWWHMPGTEAWDAAAGVAARLQQLAPAFSKLKPARFPIALLYPLSQECVDHLRAQVTTTDTLPQHDVWVWRTWHAYQDAYYSLKFAHVPFEPLFEESLAAGKLPYHAVIIPHADYLRQASKDRLLQYIADGGTVFLGASSHLKLPGARKLPVDFLTLFNTYFPLGRRADWQKGRIRCAWIDALREKAARLQAPLAPLHFGPLTVSEPEVVYNLRDGDEVTYLFLINDTTTNPITDEQRALRPGFAHFAIMPMAFHPARVHVALKGERVLYDVFEREPVRTRFGEGETSFETTIAGGATRLLASVPEPIAAVKLEAPDQVVAGEPLHVEAAVWTGTKLLSGVVPLAIRLEAGGAVRTCHAATDKGQFKGDLPTDIELPAGSARLAVTELISGRTATRTLRILPAQPVLTRE